MMGLSRSFLTAFLPGVLLGGSWCYLLLSLWSGPSALQDAMGPERQSAGVSPLAAIISEDQEGEGHSQSMQQQQQQKRRVLDYPEGGPNCSLARLKSLQRVTGQYTLLVLIHSTPKALDMRNAVRDSWLKPENRGQKRGSSLGRFVVGLGGLSRQELELLACESLRHEDMVFLPNHVESTDDDDDDTSAGGRDFSSAEKLLQSLAWAQDNVDFRYLMKCTHSTFAVLDTIIMELERREGRDGGDNLVWGFFAGGLQATKEGYLAEKDWYLCTHYLPYPEGGGFVVSRELVAMLSVLDAETGLERYRHDDIALGVWLSPFNGIERKHDVRFNTGYYSRGCNNAYLLTHRENSRSMRKKAQSLERTGKLCDREFSAKPSYHYNWSVPSNRCCIRESGVP